MMKATMHTNSKMQRFNMYILAMFMLVKKIENDGGE
jgi:hypothetical protein